MSALSRRICLVKNVTPAATDRRTNVSDLHQSHVTSLALKRSALGLKHFCASACVKLRQQNTEDRGAI